MPELGTKPDPAPHVLTLLKNESPAFAGLSLKRKMGLAPPPAAITNRLRLCVRGTVTWRGLPVGCAVIPPGRAGEGATVDAEVVVGDLHVRVAELGRVPEHVQVDVLLVRRVADALDWAPTGGRHPVGRQGWADADEAQRAGRVRGRDEGVDRAREVGRDAGAAAGVKDEHSVD